MQISSKYCCNTYRKFLFYKTRLSSRENTAVRTTPPSAPALSRQRAVPDPSQVFCTGRLVCSHCRTHTLGTQDHVPTRIHISPFILPNLLTSFFPAEIRLLSSLSHVWETSAPASAPPKTTPPRYLKGRSFLSHTWSAITALYTWQRDAVPSHLVNYTRCFKKIFNSFFFWK